MHLGGSRDIGAASFHQVFQLRPLACHQELRCRAVQTGLIKLPDGRAEIEELAAQGLDFPFQRVIVHGGFRHLSQTSCPRGGKPPQAVVVKNDGGERCGNAGTRFRQARLREASASERIKSFCIA